jgi:hypothetical protein
MNSRLEQWVRDHREEFDTEEPDGKIWDKISEEFTSDSNKKSGKEPGSLPEVKRGRLVRFNPARWSAAAAVILVVAGMAWYFSTRSTSTSTSIPIAKVDHSDNHTTSPSPNPAAASSGHDTGSARPVEGPTLANIRPATPEAGTAAGDNSMDEEMYHYARLVEIKHNQLKSIEKDEPLLYKQFASDVSKLDSVYHSLQSQLPKNPNREQLLEAMLQNLQLQMGLLNHQLDIIKQINHSKQSEYEKAHKTA